MMGDTLESAERDSPQHADEPLPRPESSSAAVDAEVLEDAEIPFASAAVQPVASAADSYGNYPYGQPYSQELAPVWYGAASPALFRSLAPRLKTYSVPKRFGMAALLAIMTALAVLFGLLRLLDTSPPIYLFFATLVVAICLAQMFFGHEPRRASAVAGAILFPFFCIVNAFLMTGIDQEIAIGVAMFSIFFGPFVGYLVGGCMAGIFLLMDKLEPYLPGGHKGSQASA